MVGTAISAFSTVQLRERFGDSFPFDLVAVLLVAYAVAAWLTLRDRPDRVIATGSMLARTMATLRMRTTLELSFLYAVAFGGFVAFSVYLPTYLKTVFELTQADAALRTAGFVILAVIMRPTGGWLSDRYHPVSVLLVAFAGTTVLALVAAIEVPLVPIGTAAFLGLAAMLGMGTGAVFALVARLVEPERVGSVTGVVGAAGGLGGFFPPLVMGAVYGATGDYSLGYVLLALTAAAALTYTATAIRRRASESR